MTTADRISSVEVQRRADVRPVEHPPEPAGRRRVRDGRADAKALFQQRPDEQFLGIADALSKLDPTLAAGLAARLGGDFQKLLPLLRQGGGAIRDVAAASATSAADLAAAKVASDAMAKAGRVLSAAWAKVAVALAPTVERIAAAVADAAERFGRVVSQNEDLVRAAVGAAAAVTGIGAALVVAAPAAASLGSALIGGIGAVAGAVPAAVAAVASAAGSGATPRTRSIRSPSPTGRRASWPRYSNGCRTQATGGFSRSGSATG